MQEPQSGVSTVKPEQTVAMLTPAVPLAALQFKRFQHSLRLHGSHLMNLQRISRIPESTRSYTPGDPINLIDWKAYARTDQLLLRQVRDEATAKVHILIDMSQTMQWPDVDVLSVHKGLSAEERKPQKAEVALRVGLHLAHLHLRSGDLVDIWLLKDQEELAPSLHWRPRSLVELMAVFMRVEAQGFSLAAALLEFSPYASLGKKPGSKTSKASHGSVDIAMYIGDGLSEFDQTAWLSAGRIPQLWHVLSSLEMNIAWLEADTSYFDAGPHKGMGETKSTRLEAVKEYQGRVLSHNSRYAEQLQVWCQNMERECRRLGGHYMLVNDALPLAHYLQQVRNVTHAT